MKGIILKILEIDQSCSRSGGKHSIKCLPQVFIIQSKRHIFIDTFYIALIKVRIESEDGVGKNIREDVCAFISYSL